MTTMYRLEPIANLDPNQLGDDLERLLNGVATAGWTFVTITTVASQTFAVFASTAPSTGKK